MERAGRRLALWAAACVVLLGVCQADNLQDKFKDIVTIKRVVENTPLQAVRVEGADSARRLLGHPTPNTATRKLKQAAQEPEGEWIEQISWKPRAYVYHNFLDPAVCDEIVKAVEPKIERSGVVHPDGTPGTDDIRTSYGAVLSDDDHPAVDWINEKLAKWTHLPKQNGEAIQVLRYENGQKYDAHMDWFDDGETQEKYARENLMTGGPRVATVLLYLSEPEEGGETGFPYGKWIDPDVQGGGSYSDCAAKGIAYRPRKGEALLFWDTKPDGRRVDPYAMHAGCPVLRGIKWTATRWIHAATFGQLNLQDQLEACINLNPDCDKWAAAGDCKTNAAYMVGSRQFLGACRKACKVCKECEVGDLLCMRQNTRVMEPPTGTSHAAPA